MSNLQDKTIVLIAGQPKAGTTSLFEWLAQHPQVAAGKLKELRFFLDARYPLHSPDRFNGANLDDYLKLFRDPGRSVLLDASPDYIGCEAPLALPMLNSRAKAILICREPVERMVSAFKYYGSIGLIPPDMTIDEYIEKQHVDGICPTTASQYRALDHCRIDHYIDIWRSAFGENLLVLEFSDLKGAPAEVFKRTLRFLGLDPNLEVNLHHGNKTQMIKFPRLYRTYGGLRRRFAQLTLQKPFIYRFLRPIGRSITNLFKSRQMQEGDIEISQYSRALISQYAGAKE